MVKQYHNRIKFKRDMNMNCPIRTKYTCVCVCVPKGGERRPELGGEN